MAEQTQWSTDPSTPQIPKASVVQTQLPKDRGKTNFAFLSELAICTKTLVDPFPTSQLLFFKNKTLTQSAFKKCDGTAEEKTLLAKHCR